MTKEHLAEIAANMTPGPWHWEGDRTKLVGKDGQVITELGHEWGRGGTASMFARGADAELVALLPEIIAELIK